MSTELTLLAWCLVLAVVQVLMPSILRIQETGPEYNASPRDVPSPKHEGVITGRLRRAQANLFETLPLFGLALLIAHAGGKEGDLTLYGAWLTMHRNLNYGHHHDSNKPCRISPIARGDARIRRRHQLRLLKASRLALRALQTGAA